MATDLRDTGSKLHAGNGQSVPISKKLSSHIQRATVIALERGASEIEIRDLFASLAECDHGGNQAGIEAFDQVKDLIQKRDAPRESGS